MLLLLALSILACIALWQQRKRDYTDAPMAYAALWYAATLPFVYIDSVALNRTAGITADALRGAVVGLFFVPPLYLALAYGKLRRKSLYGPILILAVAVVPFAILAGLFFARLDPSSILTS